MSCVATCNSCKCAYSIEHGIGLLSWGSSRSILSCACTGWCLLKSYLPGEVVRIPKMTSKKKICPCWHAQLDTILPLGCVCPYSEPPPLASLGRPKWDISLTRLLCFSKGTNCYFRTEAVAGSSPVLLSMHDKLFTCQAVWSVWSLTSWCCKRKGLDFCLSSLISWYSEVRFSLPLCFCTRFVSVYFSADRHKENSLCAQIIDI